MNWPEAFFALGLAYLFLRALGGCRHQSVRYAGPKDKDFVPYMAKQPFPGEVKTK